MSAVEPFGSWVRRLRRSRDLTQAELAAHVGCSAITVRKIEADVRTPSRQIVLRLAQMLEVPASEQARFLAAARLAPREHTASLVPPATPPLQPVPQPTTPILGRAADSTTLLELLHTQQHRLITLVGPPGIGKTRLALHVLALVQQSTARPFATVAFAPLAQIQEPRLVLDVAAQVLGVPDAPNVPPRERVQRGIDGQPVLLVLDNLEHVIAAAADIAALLEHCPHLTVLATSRAALRIRGERLYPVGALALPPTQTTAHLAQIAAAPAVQLLVERVRAVDASFTLDSTNAATAVEICARLDGVPLAIELVAARARLLGLPDLLTRLDQPLRLLVAGPHDLPVRHQTLRAAIAWSYALLQPAEQRLLRCLGMLVGSYDVRSIEALYDAPDVLEPLEALLNHSLITRVPGATNARYSTFEIVREFALEQLRAADEEAPLRMRHAHYLLSLAERAEAHRDRPEHRLWLSELDAELTHVRVVLHWAGAHASPVALQLAALLKTFWHTRGLLSEGRAYLELALSAPAAAQPDRARGLAALGELALLQGDRARAATALAESLAIFEALSDQRGVADALHLTAVLASYREEHDAAQQHFSISLAIYQALGAHAQSAATLLRLGQVAKNRGDLHHAEHLLHESLALYRRAEHERGAAHALLNLSIISYWLGDYAATASHARAAIDILRAHADQLGLAFALENLGMARYRQGFNDEAQATLHESFALFQAMQNESGMALVLQDLGWILLSQQEHHAAEQTLREALALAERIDERRRTAFCLEALGAVLSSTQPLTAARLWGEASALRTTIKSPLPAAEQATLAPFIAAAQAACSATAWEHAWRIGAQEG